MMIQAWIKEIDEFIMFEMKFMSMIGKTVRDNTSDQKLIYLGPYYVILDGLTYHKQLYFSASIAFLL